MEATVKANPENKVLRATYKRLDEYRANYAWQALDTAKAESLQGWRYLEDGSDFVNALLIKYEGDLSKCTHLEKLKSEYIEKCKQQRILATGQRLKVMRAQNEKNNRFRVARVYG